MKVKAIVIKIRVKINIWQPTYTVGCKAILQKKNNNACILQKKIVQY